MRRDLGLPLGHPAALIATGFGLGLLPLAPGSWAALAALPAAWAIRALGGIGGLAAAVVLALAAGWWAAGRVAQASGRGDPGAIVIDEIAAQWLVLLVAPRDPWSYAAAFALFRLFDITKVWPASWVDRRLHGGHGIMLDDVVAALYAMMLLWIGEGVLGVRS